MAPSAILVPCSSDNALPSPPRTPGLSKKRVFSDDGTRSLASAKRARLETPSALRSSRSALDVSLSTIKDADSRFTPPASSGQQQSKSDILVREEIRHALHLKGQGDSEPMDNIRSLFKTDDPSAERPSSETLRQYLIGLNSNATLLRKSSSDLVHTILESQWLLFDDHVINAYMRFLGGLASAQSGYIPTIFKMLVNNFAHLSTSAGESQRRSLGGRLRHQARVHSTIKYLLQLVPSSRGVLLSAMSACFPHESDSNKAHTEFVRNLLRVAEYAPELKCEISSLVTERLIKIDVHIQGDIEELMAVDDDGFISDILTRTQPSTSYTRPLFGSSLIDDDASDSGSDADDESDDDEDELDEESIKARELRASIQKMDAILHTLFTVYSPVFYKSGSLDSDLLYSQLLSEFQQTILPTYRSRHTQFLVFHFAQSSEERMLKFIDLCFAILRDRSRNPVLRSSAAAYIGNFVARGAKIPSDIAAYTFNTLLEYADKLRQEHEPACFGPDLGRFKPYYAAMQAVMYLFCFRWRDLTAEPYDFDEQDPDEEFDPKNLTWAGGVQELLQRNCYSTLNPLKICAPTIVDEFARTTLHMQVLYIYQIIDANKRVRISRQPTGASTPTLKDSARHMARGEQKLDAYFPFDPYHLPRSKQWLIGDYSEWKGAPGLVEDSDYESSNDSDSEHETGPLTSRSLNGAGRAELPSLTPESDK